MFYCETINLAMWTSRREKSVLVNQIGVSDALCPILSLVMITSSCLDSLWEEDQGLGSFLILNSLFDAWVFR